MVSELDGAAELLSNESVTLAKVDCAQAKGLCFSYVSGGYPTARLFQKENHTLFDGERTKEGIAKWIRLHLLPSYQQVSTIDEADKIKIQHDYSLVGQFNSESDPAFQAFKDSCSKTQTKAARIAIINSSIDSPRISMYHRIENESEELTSTSITSDVISRFEVMRARPFVEEVSPFNGRRIAQSRLPTLYFFIDPRAPDYAAQQEAVLAAGHTNRDTVLFSLVDVRRFGRMMPGLGLPEGVAPACSIEVAVEPLEKNDREAASAHYAHPSTGTFFNTGAITAFVDRFLNGSLSPTIRSQPRPQWQFSNVTMVVGQTFDEVVLDEEKDVLLRLVTPWCLPCNRTAPLLHRIADDLAEARIKGGEEGSSASNPPSADAATRQRALLASRVVIAEMDVSENDPPPALALHGHPTLILFPAHNKKHPVYSSDWYSYEKMKLFLKEQLMKEERWKGQEDSFPLTINWETIQDENEIIQFDNDFAKQKFNKIVRRRAAAAEAQTSESLGNKTDL